MRTKVTGESMQTAIPDRFVEQRQRVLRILARWEDSLAPVLGQADAPGGREGQPGAARP